MTTPRPDDPAFTATLGMTEPTADQLWTDLRLPMRTLISAALGLVGGGGGGWRDAEHGHVVDSIMATVCEGLTSRLQHVIDDACRAAVIAELRRLADDNADPHVLRDRAHQLDDQILRVTRHSERRPTMSDISCSHCGKPWDVYELMHDSIGNLEPYGADELKSLEPVNAVVLFLKARNSAENVSNLATTLRSIGGVAQQLTVADLAEWWSAHEADDSATAKAVKLVLCTAIYRGVLRGKGCLACGFNHDGVGPYREHTVYEMVMDGVIDDDPTEFIDG